MIVKKAALFILIVTLTPSFLSAAINGRGLSSNTVAVVAPPEQTATVPPPHNVSGQIFKSNGQPADRVQVVFTRQDTPESASVLPQRVLLPPLPLLTDMTGHYSLHLGDGQWRGYVCGSRQGYSPLFWDVAIYNGVVTSFYERRHVAPIIEKVEVNHPLLLRSTTLNHIPEESRIIVSGDGFGCSGYILMTIGDKQLNISDFVTQKNKQLEFILPDLTDLGLANTTSFKITYINGNSRSVPATWELSSPPTVWLQPSTPAVFAQPSATAEETAPQQDSQEQPERIEENPNTPISEMETKKESPTNFQVPAEETEKKPTTPKTGAKTGLKK